MILKWELERKLIKLRNSLEDHDWNSFFVTAYFQKLEEMTELDQLNEDLEWSYHNQ